MKKIVVGVLGAGRIGQVHMNAMKLNPNVRIKTVADAFINEKIEKALKPLGVEYITKDANEIFKDEEIDAVFICSPTDTHYKFSISGIDKNKHVFCEKPVDMDLGRIKDVQSKLNKSSIVYQVGFNRRFDHNFRSIRDTVQKNKIGTPQMIRITSRDPAPPPIEYIKNSGGIFMDMMIHDFDMARYQTGSEVLEVYAIADALVDKNIAKVGGDVDSAIVTLKFKNGMIGLIENCRQAAYGYDQRVEVLGTKGAVSIDNDTSSTLTLSNTTGVIKEKPLHFFLERYKDAYMLEQQYFFDAIRKNKKAPCGIDDGYESTRLAYAAAKSLKEHRPVGLSEIK